jgi:phosphatidylglycerophosphate synthase
MRAVIWLLALAALAVALAIAGRHNDGYVLFVLAGISDALDGYLAKHFGWRSRLGTRCCGAPWPCTAATQMAAAAARPA